MTKTLLDKALESTLKAVERELPDNQVAMVFLTGSRLYGYNREDSDFDFKVYVKPTQSQLVFGEQVSKEVGVYENMVEAVDVKDLRYVVKELQKPSVNSMHLLFDPVAFNSFSVAYSEDLFFNGTVLKDFRGRLKTAAMVSFGDYGDKNFCMSLLGSVKPQNQDKRKNFVNMCLLLAEQGFLNRHNSDYNVASAVAYYGLASYEDLGDSLNKRREECFEAWQGQAAKKHNLNYKELLLR